MHNSRREYKSLLAQMKLLYLTVISDLEKNCKNIIRNSPRPNILLKLLRPCSGYGLRLHPKRLRCIAASQSRTKPFYHFHIMVESRIDTDIRLLLAWLTDCIQTRPIVSLMSFISKKKCDFCPRTQSRIIRGIHLSAV